MYTKAFIHSILYSVGLFLLHFGINSVLNPISWKFLILIHGIMFIMTFGGYCLLLATKTFDKNKIGFAFLAVSTLKLLLSASIILILVRGLGYPKGVAIHFSAVYFFYVLFLAFKTFKMLNSLESEN